MTQAEKTNTAEELVAITEETVVATEEAIVPAETSVSSVSADQMTDASQPEAPAAETAGEAAPKAPKDAGAKPAPRGRRGGKSSKVRKLPRSRIVKVLSVGMEVAGTVKRTSEFGAFVDIGVGRDGLLHVSELAVGRVRSVTDVIKEGDEVTVWIKKLDRERNRISLTMIPPGTKTIRDLSEGELVSGTVQKITNYGAFVDIGMERDALLHVKEMSDGYVNKPEDVAKIGDEIEARIIGVNRRRGQVDLSLKGLRPPVDEDVAVQLEPLSFADEDEEDAPTVMELAFRQAFDGDFPMEDMGRRGRSKSRKRKGRRDSQHEIISRTLRYSEERS